ncbi:MAG: hypothetical protein ABIE22_03440 [archaeon]
MSITNFDALCLECREPIHNPLCPFCLSRGIEAWLENKPTKMSNFVENEIKKILGARKLGNSVKCIACNSDRAFLCPYCFTEMVYKALKKVRARKADLEEFMILFNFDFEHCGYYKDAEKLGIV